MPESLRVEGRLLGRLVLGREPDPEFVERYVEAHEHLFREPVRENDAAVMALIARRPWLLGCVDSAAALIQPGALVHRKALLMAAILEASPRYADEFLPRRTTWSGLLWIGVGAAVATVCRLVIGIPVLMMVKGGGAGGGR